jgi:hypothetical protein
MASAAPTISIQYSSNAEVLAAGATRPAAVSVPLQLTKSVTYTNGTGSGALNCEAYLSDSATAATPEDLDLTLLVRTDGGTGFSNCKFLEIFNDHATAQLTIKAPASNGFNYWAAASGDGFIIEPLTSKVIYWSALSGGTVNGTNKLVTVDPGASTIAYRVIAAGLS